jgi:hypothetical protein
MLRTATINSTVTDQQKIKTQQKKKKKKKKKKKASGANSFDSPRDMMLLSIVIERWYRIDKQNQK